MTDQLTPYDTGKRLEPKPWLGDDPDQEDRPTFGDDYGKVDFDNEESATCATLWVERNEDGSYMLHGYTTVKLHIEIKEE